MRRSFACLFVVTACASTPLATGGASVDRDAGGAPVEGDGGAPPMPAAGLADAVVVCRTCSAALLDAKRDGVRLAMRLLVAYAGADVLAARAPVTFHLDDDATCGSADDLRRSVGYVTGFASIDAEGRGHVCLFDVEKTNRALPFTAANARLLPDQVLPIHEALHVWLADRAADARLQEPLAKIASLALSGVMPDPCAGFRDAALGDALIPGLCDAGMTVTDVPAILARVAAEARVRGRALTNEEVCDAISQLLGADASPAFRAAALL